MMPSASIHEELGEALSRAAVLRSLDSAYAHTTPGKRMDAVRGASNSSKATHSKSDSKHNTPKAGSQMNANDEVVSMMRSLVGDNSSKTSKFFMDQIKGKSIILENVKAQTEATKYAEKEKRRMKRRVKISNTALKKSGAILWHDISKMRVPSKDELLGLNNSWKTYSRNLLKGCKSTSHCQARLMTAELVGAEIIVLDSKGCTNVVGKKGIIVEQSENCYFVVCSEDTPAATAGVGGKRKREGFESKSDGNKSAPDIDATTITRQKIYRVVKSMSVVGIILPVTVHRSSHHDSSGELHMTSDVAQNVCVLYGDKILPTGRPATSKAK